jgi:hypothetical protein
MKETNWVENGRVVLMIILCFVMPSFPQLPHLAPT